MSHPLASVCTLCLKHVSGGGGSVVGSSRGGGAGGGGGDEIQRPLVLLGRILKTSSLKNTKIGVGVVAANKHHQFTYFCDDCASILDSLRACYEQMKALELRLDWNLWKLQKVASFAARVPSRVAGATELYTRAGRMDELEAVRGWRSVFLRKCTLKLSTRFPKVKLSRIQQENHPQLPQSITEESRTPNEAPNKNKTIIEAKDVGGSEDHYHHHSDIDTSTSRGQITDDDDDDGYEEEVQVSPDNKLELADPPVVATTGAESHQELQVISSSQMVLVKTDPDPPPTGGAPQNVDYYDHVDDYCGGVKSPMPSPPQSIFPAVVTMTALPVGQQGEGDSETIQETPPDDDTVIQLSSTADSRLRACLQCSSCSKTFSTVDNLKSHESSSHSTPVDRVGKVELANRDVGDEEEEEHQNQVDSDSDFEAPNADDSDEDEEELESELKSDSEDDEKHLNSGDDEHERRTRRSSKESVCGRRRRKKVQICSICNRRIRGGPWEYKRHYIKHHQIDGVAPSQIQHCEVDQCSAYFLTVLQLNIHQRLEHGGGGGVVQSEKNFFQNLSVRGGRKFFNFEVDSACKLCHKMFLTPELLTQHAKIFHPVEPGVSGDTGGGDDKLYSCEVEACSTHCPSGELLQEHMERVHQAELAPSIVPSLSAPAPGVLPPSVLESSEELGSRTCDVCQMVFRRSWGCKVHFKTSHDVTGLEEEEVKRCGEGQCGAYFRTEHQLSLHMIRSHRKAKVTTDHHQGRQSTQDSEDDEQTRQVGDNELRKSSEGKNASSKWVSKPRLYCPVCPRWYFDNNMRVDHFKNWHDLTLMMSSSSPAAAWSCDQPHCSAYFVQRSQLAVHLEEAHQRRDPSLTCSDCGNRFRRKFDLKEHRGRTHDKHLLAKSHACSFEGCGKAFAVKRDLRRHERDGHQGRWGRKKKNNKPLELSVCDVCGKRVSKVNLELHKLTHSGPDSYPCQCSTCGKKFINKAALDRHSRTHSQEKPYVCQYCGKRFVHDSLRRHVRNNHPDVSLPLPPRSRGRLKTAKPPTVE